ncbi:MAG: threonine--tRNA ligase [Nanoarchaeota archaeon]|nr:threonine--tRNA ligase [Nanoarchaeota archaeon]
MVKEPSDLEKLRHSVAHLLAAAVMDLWPDTKRTIGPAIEHGFYFDFEFSKPVVADDLEKIEKKMRQLLPSWKNFERHELSADQAKKEYPNNQFKHELIDEFSELGKKKVSFYKSGEYWDLCRGGHVEDMKLIKADAFKLMKLAGAYWHGDAKNPMLTRIYGTAFFSKKELDEYLRMLEEAEKRNHMVLGKKLQLFEVHEESPGAPFFYPKGTIIYLELMKFLREEYVKRGYKEVITPLLYDKSLWETSGHWEHYRENMFLLNVDNRDFSLKPMNCPSHCLMFRNLVSSYRDLPLRLADFAAIHRNELKGVLSGLTRVRKFSTDDAHNFVAEEDLQKEILGVIDFVEFVYKKTFNLDVEVKLSTRPEKRMGADAQWDKAEQALESALKEKGLSYVVDAGEGAFYGPKIDIFMKDCLQRLHQVATIQVDFQLPARFGLQFDGQDGKKHTPIMVHRAIFGSLERFIGVLTEHFEAKFPLWLAPVQAVVMNITEKNEGYAQKVADQLRVAGVRVEIDISRETINKKVRNAQMQHINYMLTVGDKEEENTTVAVRTLDGKVKFGVGVAELVAELKQLIVTRALAW